MSNVLNFQGMDFTKNRIKDISGTYTFGVDSETGKPVLMYNDMDTGVLHTIPLDNVFDENEHGYSMSVEELNSILSEHGIRVGKEV